MFLLNLVVRRNSLAQRQSKSMLHPSLWLIGAIGLGVAISYFPLRLAIAARQTPHPEAILMLGGRPAREPFTAEFAKTHPHLRIWLSSGLGPLAAKPLFQQAGITEDRVHLDYRAVDTVTNFTTLVDDLAQHHIKHVYLITSDFHMPRSQAIATIILGSRGIAFTPVIVPSAEASESPIHVGRDVIRSVFWLATGFTGSQIGTAIRWNRR
jgi:uncharacterized SAM-binding protein YcdF (DUF218 family)